MRRFRYLLGLAGMSISFSLPNDIETDLRRRFGDLDQVAKVAALVALYQQGGLSHGQFAECLGVSRYYADGILKRHGVTDDMSSLEEIDEQVAYLSRRLGT